MEPKSKILEEFRKQITGFDIDASVAVDVLEQVLEDVDGEGCPVCPEYARIGSNRYCAKCGNPLEGE